MKNSNKMGEKSEKNRGWVVMTLGTIFRVQGVQGPGCISKCGKCGCAKMKNTNKIGKKSEKIGDG
jgi:hypothetical protein